VIYNRIKGIEARV